MAIPSLYWAAEAEHMTCAAGADRDTIGTDLLRHADRHLMRAYGVGTSECGKATAKRIFWNIAGLRNIHETRGFAQCSPTQDRTRDIGYQ